MKRQRRVGPLDLTSVEICVHVGAEVHAAALMGFEIADSASDVRSMPAGVAGTSRLPFVTRLTLDLLPDHLQVDFLAHDRALAYR